MTRLAIIYPSHRPHLVMRSYSSRKALGDLDYKFCVIGQNPVTHEMLSKLEDTRFVIVDPPKVPGLIEMVRWYQIGFDMAKDADYFLIVDDDHHWKEITFNHPSSGEYIKQCLDWMDVNPDVGFLMTKGYFGSAAWGDAFVKSPTNGLVNLDRGMIMRNIPEFKFTEEEQSFVGTLVESLLGYKIMAMGYKIAKRFCNPTLKDRGKRLNSGGISYSDETLTNNIMGYIRRIYNDPTWTHESRKYPRGLMAMHRKARNDLRGS